MRIRLPSFLAFFVRFCLLDDIFSFFFSTIRNLWIDNNRERHEKAGSNSEKNFHCRVRSDSCFFIGNPPLGPGAGSRDWREASGAGRPHGHAARRRKDPDRRRRKSGRLGGGIGDLRPGHRVVYPRTAGDSSPLGSRRAGAEGDAETYEPATNRFVSANALMGAPRFFHSAVLLASGEVLIAGGVGTDGAPPHPTEIFDPPAMEIFLVSRR